MLVLIETMFIICHTGYPGPTRFHYIVENSILFQNKYEEAEKWLKKAYELDPNDSSMLHHYGEL